MNEKVIAIIVLYNPAPDDLQRSILEVSCQVEKTILVDNSPIKLGDDFLVAFPKSSQILYHFNGGNLGVAKAQNIGIQLAIEMGAEYVLILDQDSVPTTGMVPYLLGDLLSLSAKNHKISAIGPEHVNKQTNKVYQPRIKKRQTFSDYPYAFNVSEIMSSGSLIKKDTLIEVGLMDESLFIDAVDHEWCWRAKQMGYTCAMSNRTKLYHMLGEGDRKIFGIPVAITSSFRVYFQYRNFVYLCFKGYVPSYWKVNNAFKYLIKFFYYPVFVKPHMSYTKNMLRGLIAGVKMVAKKK